MKSIDKTLFGEHWVNDTVMYSADRNINWSNMSLKFITWESVIPLLEIYPKEIIALEDAYSFVQQICIEPL